jgi:hypothetical protein
MHKLGALKALSEPLSFIAGLYRNMVISTCGLVAMTSASHAEGRQFDPGQVYCPDHRWQAWMGCWKGWTGSSARLRGTELIVGRQPRWSPNLAQHRRKPMTASVCHSRRHRYCSGIMAIGRVCSLPLPMGGRPDSPCSQNMAQRPSNALGPACLRCG